MPRGGKVAGRRLELTDELVEVEPGHRNRIVSEDATIPYALTVTYEDEGDGTRVSGTRRASRSRGSSSSPTRS